MLNLRKPSILLSTWVKRVIGNLEFNFRFFLHSEIHSGSGSKARTFAEKYSDSSIASIASLLPTSTILLIGFAINLKAQL